MGVFMFLLTFLVAPIVAAISEFLLGIEPYPVGVVIILLAVGGLLRTIYALLFESKDPYEGTVSREVPAAVNTFSSAALPPQQPVPASEYVSPGGWRDVETQTPAGVTDNATTMLDPQEEEWR